MRREVVDELQLTQPGFAVNAETGLQPLLMGYAVKEVPISWINRTPDMGVSSFNLAKVGGGYWQVLFRLWRRTFFGFKRLPQKKKYNHPLEKNSIDKDYANMNSIKSNKTGHKKPIVHKPLHKGERFKIAVRSDQGAKVFVLGVLILMTIIDLVVLVKSGRIFPLNEDWWLVPPLTGNEPNIASWFWGKNSEHWIPFPRLILLALLKASGGDFRIGMLFNIIILASLAFAMILVARHIRGGRVSYVDAFFPIALLHLGNSENLFWCWQITQVLPTVLTCIILLVLVINKFFTTAKASIVGGITLMLLPLSGSHSLIFSPLLSLWFAYSGVLNLSGFYKNKSNRMIGYFLIVSAVISLCFTGIYFISYERPSWMPPDPNIFEALTTAVKFLSLGFGPTVRGSWTFYLISIIGVYIFSIAIAGMGFRRYTGYEKHRALGLIILLLNIGLLALAVGWSRTTAITYVYGQYPIRYVLMAVPALLTSFFVWELYGFKRLRIAIQGGLLLAICVLMPSNTHQGLNWLYWFTDKDRLLIEDLNKGLPAPVLAERHKELLLHWIEPSELANYIRMLNKSRLGPFLQMGMELSPEINSSKDLEFSEELSDIEIMTRNNETQEVTQEYNYFMPEAGEVYFVWGINGWKVAHTKFRPKDTEIKNMVMHTPMAQIDDVFIVSISVPSGTAIDYCFLITEKKGSFDITWPICEGNYRETILNSGTKKIRSKLTLDVVTKEVKYTLPKVNKVDLVWGINGWHVVPEELRPKGTILKNKVMHTPMFQEGTTFVTKIQVPVGTTINYGFHIKERSGIFKIFHPVWDGDYNEIPSKNDIIEQGRDPTLSWDLSEMDLGMLLMIGIVILFCISVIINRLLNPYR
jgi:hypothetical protein